MSNLIKHNAILTDEWTLVTLPAPAEDSVRKQAGKVVIFKVTGEPAATPDQLAGATIPAQGKILLPLTLWNARKSELTPRMAQGEIGLWIESYELLEDLLASVEDLNALPVIAIHFPRFVDGRGFSLATLLRTRYGYKHELRAIGDVLRDQLYFMKRCGFDAFALRADRSAEDALASLRDFSEPYQGAVDNPLPVWRRHPRVGYHATAKAKAQASQEDQVD
jgi:uncharacterized protein (DUF934 family)